MISLFDPSALLFLAKSDEVDKCVISMLIFICLREKNSVIWTPNLDKVVRFWLVFSSEPNENQTRLN